MLAEFFGVLLLLLVALAVAGAFSAAGRWLAPQRPRDETRAPYESGEPGTDPSRRVSVKFYLVAMLFVLFELETVFFMPWAALFRSLGSYGVGVMLVFAVPLVLGLVYEWRKGVLQW